MLQVAELMHPTLSFPSSLVRQLLVAAQRRFRDVHPAAKQCGAPDPLEQFHSPYLANFTNPANFIDPDGRLSIAGIIDSGVSLVAAMTADMTVTTLFEAFKGGGGMNGGASISGGAAIVLKIHVFWQNVQTWVSDHHHRIVQSARSRTAGAGEGSSKIRDEQKGPHQPNIFGAPEHKRGSILNPNTNSPVKDRQLTIEEARTAFRKPLDDPYYGKVKGSNHWEKVYYDETYQNGSATGAYFAASPFVAEHIVAGVGTMSLFEENPYADVIPEDKLKQIVSILESLSGGWIVPDHLEVRNPDPTIVIFTGRNSVTDPVTIARIDNYSKQLMDYISMYDAVPNIKIIFSPESKPQVFEGDETIVGEGIIAMKFFIKAFSYGF
jgi:hypothetical protein